MEQTKNLNLNRWAPEDFVRLTQINQNFDKIDEEVGTLKMEHLALGTYTGDGADSRTIELPFAPKLAILMGTVNDEAGISILTQTNERYISSSGAGSLPQYNPSLQDDQLQIRNRFWHNGKGKIVQYILFG